MFTQREMDVLLLEAEMFVTELMAEIEVEFAADRAQTGVDEGIEDAEAFTDEAATNGIGAPQRQLP